MWYEWDSEADFNAWHNTLCNELGYPLVGINQQTGLPDDKAQKTEAYTEAFEVGGKWIAWVDLIYANGLVDTELRPPVKLLDLGL
jgi:hypothetical protein